MLLSCSRWPVAGWIEKPVSPEIAGQAAAGEEETLLGVDGQRRGHAGQRVVGVVFQRTGGRVEGVLGDAVFLLERYVHESGHFITS